MNALQPGVEFVDDKCPVGIVAEFGDVAAAAPLDLVRQHLQEGSRPAAELDHLPAGATRLCSDRQSRRP